VSAVGAPADRHDTEPGRGRQRRDWRRGRYGGWWRPWGSDRRRRRLVRLGVDVIVARGPTVIKAVQKTTATIPIVMSSARDPVALGFVKTLARPGGNITGIASLLGEREWSSMDGPYPSPRPRRRRWPQVWTARG
jgi:hypothetical protein